MFSAPVAKATRPCGIAVFALLFLTCTGHAQGVSFGLSVGVPLNHLATADSSATATTCRYTFGPTLQVGLSHGFGFEAELLYKRLGFGLESNPAVLAVHRLELPLLLRYVFRGSAFHPFLDAGVSFNRVIAVSGSNACAETVAREGVYCIGDKTVVALRHRHTRGFILGAGVDFARGSLRLSPELRVSRWVDRNFGTRDSLHRSNLTQIELLLGLKF